MEETVSAAVFIDLNNVEESIQEYKEAGMFLDYSRLVDVLTDGMRPTSVKVYDSIPRNNPDLTALHDVLESAGFDLVLKVPAPLLNNMERTCCQKEVDTSLVADVVSIGYENRYDTAIIISGDRDMRPAADCIERIGKKAVFVSCYDVMCSELRSREGSLFIDDLYVLQAIDYSTKFECRSTADGCVMKEAVADEA